MMAVTMKMFTLGLLAISLVVGCSPRKVSLDEEISELPVAWSGFKTIGASSNNWALLDRVSAVEDDNEKIRLVIKLRNRLRSRPEEILANDRKGNHYIFNERMRFEESCSWRLISCTNQNPRMVFEGWKLKAEWIDGLEELDRLTAKDWNGGVYDRHASEEARNAWSFASRVRRVYDLYFKYTFSSCVGSYRGLPPSSRPAFVEQIKRDFFHRKGMALVDLSVFPPEFKK